MLSFATEFPTRETDADQFVASVRDWIAGSPHSKISADRFEEFPREGFWNVRENDEHLQAIVTRGAEERIAFRYRKFERHLTWTTTVVYSVTDGAAWVGIRTFRDSSQAREELPPAKKPFLVRTLLQHLGGGLDGELYVQDSPHALKDNDVSMAARLLNGDSDNHLPVVYVSVGFNGLTPVDQGALARALGGMAHVLSEPGRAFSRLLQAEVDSRNVYGGTVGVYWSGGFRKSFYFSSEIPTEFELRRAISDYIRSALINRRPFNRCTWEDTEALAARKVFEDLRSSGSENVDDYVRLFDTEMKARAQQLEQAEAENQRLRAQLRAAESSTARRDGQFSLKLAEQEFFPGEFTEIIGEALSGAIERVPAGSRRQNILMTIVESNHVDGLLGRKREELKGVLRGYKSMGRDVSDGLAALGFQVTDDGKHYKLVYQGDGRYTFALPKSGSDHRGGLNAASDISKRCF